MRYLSAGVILGVVLLLSVFNVSFDPTEFERKSLRDFPSIQDTDDFDVVLAYVRVIQSMVIDEIEQGASIPLGQERSSALVREKKLGLCYDRVRVLSQIFEKSGSKQQNRQKILLKHPSCSSI